MKSNFPTFLPFRGIKKITLSDTKMHSHCKYSDDVNSTALSRCASANCLLSTLQPLLCIYAHTCPHAYVVRTTYFLFINYHMFLFTIYLCPILLLCSFPSILSGTLFVPLPSIAQCSPVQRLDQKSYSLGKGQ